MPIDIYGPDDGPDTVYLSAWSIRQLPNGERRFCGYGHHEGRVSTAIVQIDPVSREGLTSSGRKYVLQGRCGHDRDAEYVWNLVLRAFKTDSWTDVTLDLIPDARKSVRHQQSG